MDERRQTFRQRREATQQQRNARREGSLAAGAGSEFGASNAAAFDGGSPSSTNARGGGAGGGGGGRYRSTNLGDKPLHDSVYSTSLRTLGHSIEGRVIFTASHLQGLGLTSLKPVAQLGQQLQRLILDNNALESLEDLSNCVSLVHLSAAGNRLEHSGVFPHLVRCSQTLTYLNLSDNKITSLQGLERLRFLVTLTLDGNQLTTLEVEGTDDSLHASANEACNEHCAALLDDVIRAIDETNAQGKPRSRRNSLSEHHMAHSGLARDSSAGLNLSRGQSIFAKSRSVSIKGVPNLPGGGGNNSSVDGSGENFEPPLIMTSPLRFLVSLWRFSAAGNELKAISPKVFERCPLRLLNLSNNAISCLDFVLPLHRTLMVLTVDGNDISHLPASGGAGGTSASGSGLRRLGSRHLGDSVHPTRAIHDRDIAHLNFQMMTTLVSLNLGRNNISSFTEIAELRHLPQLRHLTLAQCTLCSLPTAADLDVREDKLKKKRVDSVRSDNDMAGHPLDAVELTAQRLQGGGGHQQHHGTNSSTHSGRNSRSSTADNKDAFASGVFGPRTETMQAHGGGGGDNNNNNNKRTNSRKESMVVINSVADFGGPIVSSASGTASGSFTVEALIRPDDAEAVMFRTPEEQDAAEFNKRTTEERYRLKVLQHVPQLQMLDGVPCTTEDIAEAQQLAGGYLREERTRAIAKYIKPASGSAGAALRRLAAQQE